MDQKIGIAFCCERGELERITMVMVKSLLQFGELPDQVKLFCFCPRPLFKPAEGTLNAFRNLGIAVIDQPQNAKYSFYPLMNKVVALKYLEENTTLDRLIFLDSDLVILKKVLDKELLDHDVALQSEFVDLMAASQRDDPYYPFWARLYHLLGIKKFSFTNIFVSGKRVFAYWNSGLISYRRELQIASRWYENLILCFGHYHWRKLEYYFLEQATLAVTFQQLRLQVHRLNPVFNYPICSHDEIHKGNKVTQFDKLHIIHYLRFADKSIDNLKKIEQANEKVEWVERMFKSYKLINGDFIRKLSDFYFGFRQSNIQKIIYFYNRFSGKIK